MRRNPSFLPIWFLVQKRERIKSIIGAKITIMRSINDVARKGRGAKMADTPRITKRFIIFDPTTFPTAISEFPLLAAMIEVASSGALVPTATIVRPMIDSESPNNFAISTAHETRSFHHPRSTSIPAIIQSVAFQGETIFSTFSPSSGMKLLCLIE